MSHAEALQYGQEEMRMGRMDAAQANVYMVQLQGVHVVIGKLGKDVRKALNEAVKSGNLGHIKGNGLMPEAYHHKNARANALVAIREVYNQRLNNLKGTFA